MITTESNKNSSEKPPKKPPKKPKDEAVVIMLSELKGMIPVFVICNAILLIVCLIYSFVTGNHDWRYYTGILFGNAATVMNFYQSGVKAGSIIRLKDAQKARRYATVNFFIRYFGAFAVFGAFIHFGLINVITAVVPLFYPKIHYTVKAVLNKEI